MDFKMNSNISSDGRENSKKTLGSNDSVNLDERARQTLVGLLGPREEQSGLGRSRHSSRSRTSGTVVNPRRMAALDETHSMSLEYVGTSTPRAAGKVNIGEVMPIGAEQEVMAEGDIEDIVEGQQERRQQQAPDMGRVRMPQPRERQLAAEVDRQDELPDFEERVRRLNAENQNLHQELKSRIITSGQGRLQGVNGQLKGHKGTDSSDRRLSSIARDMPTSKLPLTQKELDTRLRQMEASAMIKAKTQKRLVPANLPKKPKIPQSALAASTNMPKLMNKSRSDLILNIKTSERSRSMGAKGDFIVLDRLNQQSSTQQSTPAQKKSSKAGVPPIAPTKSVITLAELHRDRRPRASINHISGLGEVLTHSLQQFEKAQTPSELRKIQFNSIMSREAGRTIEPSEEPRKVLHHYRSAQSLPELDQVERPHPCSKNAWSRGSAKGAASKIEKSSTEDIKRDEQAREVKMEKLGYSGLSSTSPLGPSLKMARSLSHCSAFEISSNIRHVQKLLGRHQKRRILENQKKLPIFAEKKFQMTKHKIESYDQSLKLKTQFLSGMLPQGCRNGVIPGQNEARDEAIRTQLLVGKLKAEGSSDILNANNGMRLKKVKTGVSITPIESKRPQILSDQASGMTFSVDSSQITDANDKSQNQMDTQRSNFRESKRKSDKLPNKIKIKKAKITMTKDYRPNDNGPVEELAELEHLSLKDWILRPKLIMDKNMDEILLELANSEDITSEIESMIESEQQLDLGLFKSKELQNILKYTYFARLKENDKMSTQEDFIKQLTIEITESQKKLDLIILMIKKHEESRMLKEQRKLQKSKGRRGHYFLYLMQNPTNAKDAYDLVPVMQDLRNDAQRQGNLQVERGDRLMAQKAAEAQNFTESINLPFTRNPSLDAEHQFKMTSSKPQNHSLNKARNSQYYTMSAESLLIFTNDQPSEILPLTGWLQERDQFQKISTLTFFKKFKTWRIFKNWRSKIVKERRDGITQKLRQKLHHLDEIFGPIMLEQRRACIQLEKLRVLDLVHPDRESFGIVEFQQRQSMIRENVESTIREASERSRLRFKGGIDQVIEGLRAKFDKEGSKDFMASMDSTKNNRNQIHSDLDQMQQETGKNVKQDPIYEQLGFKNTLKYGARSQLREACLKFLRYSFLHDYIALESLSNICLLTIEDGIKKLAGQANEEVDYEFKNLSAVAVVIEEEPTSKSKKPAGVNLTQKQYEVTQTAASAVIEQAAEVEIPIFTANVLFRVPSTKIEDIPEEHLFIEQTPEFQLPPIGKSKREDFNPMCHLELLEDKAEEGEAADNAGARAASAADNLDEDDLGGMTTDSEQDQGNKDPQGRGAKGKQPSYYVPPTEDELHQKEQQQILQVPKLKDIQNLWLSIYPDKQVFSHVLCEAFQLGFDSLLNFERWSMHEELAVYDAVLESYDYRSYDKWEAPEEDDALYLNCEEWLSEQPSKIHLDNNIDYLVDKVMQKVTRQLEEFEPFLNMYWVNHQCMPFEVVVDPKLKNPTDVLPMLLQRFLDQKFQFENFIPMRKDIGILTINFAEVKEALMPNPSKCLAMLRGLLPLTVKRRVQDCARWINEQVYELRLYPQNVDEFVKQVQCLQYVEEHFEEIKQRLELCDHLFRILDQYDMLTREDRQTINLGETYVLTNTLTTAIYDTKDKTQSKKDHMKKITKNKIPIINENVEQFRKLVEDEEFLEIELHDVDQQTKPIADSELLDLGVLESKIRKLDEIEALFDEMDAEHNKVVAYQTTLEIEKIEHFANVEEVRLVLFYRSKLWRSLQLWRTNTESWKKLLFLDIDMQRIAEQSMAMTKTVLQCERNLPPSSALQYFKQIVWDFKETMPIVEALDNPNLEGLHFEQIKQLINVAEFPFETKQFTLGELIKLDVAKYQDIIVNISVTATQEHNIFAQLEALKNTWYKLDFDVVNHKTRDTFKIVGFDQITQVLDESLSTINIMVSSRFVKRYQKEVEDFQDILNLISDCLEQWKEAQRGWIYLENIFSSPDIRKQRPRDYQDFEIINRSWAKMMKQVYMNRNVRKNISSQKMNDFKKWNKIMEKIQKSLETYLEDKRSYFARFYFISNDELLQILANSTDLKTVERHMIKCFENVNKFVLADDEVQYDQDGEVVEVNPAELNEVFGIRSDDNEKLEFVRSVKVRAQGVEQWLLQLEEYIQQAVQKKIKLAYNDYYGTEDQEVERNEWAISKHPSQAISAVGQITWTEGTEMAINELVADPYAVEDYLLILKQQLSELTVLIRSDRDQIQRKTLVALITQDVHARDIEQKLYDQKIQSCLDFLWQQQLRYYIEEDNVIVRQVNTLIEYGYEYIGPTTRLIITPLTDKCWITITGAMHIKLGAAPSGPAGTGKTESTKDLAKACGIFCVVYNCSGQIEYQMMAKLFSGLVQTGAWSCLDEFNRINPEVLSVIAQQLVDIKQAKVLRKEEFFFNGKDRILKKHCGVFVTMNPGYKGRVELPDNLKVLFRPVSMMIPNYQLIAEIMLFGEGFQEATKLSTKMVQLYKLASEQLSQQDHYDFGLRAVKSVLVMAGNLKRKYPDLDENILLIQAMRDSNVPKFLSHDLPLFQALIQDLFPETEIPESRNLELEEMIEETMDQMKLQRVDVIKKKTLQLFETMNVRFGVMIVGPAGGGKTTIYRILAECLKKLRQMGSEDIRYQEVKYKLLNPKAITMGELYGEINVETQDWVDGLASKILRKFAKNVTARRSWCIFDGPVDALWIENMNSVLDDNMMLSLMNGERIKLNPTIRILFEVMDLAVASPATVSRCGMVYLSPQELPWRPIFLTWMRTYIIENDLLSERQQKYLTDLFDVYIDQTFEKAEQYADQEQLVTIKNQKIACICNFLEYFIQKANAFAPSERKNVWTRKLYAYFAFSVIWGYGSAFKSGAHRYLDSIFRDLFVKLHIPRVDTVYQYYYEPLEMKFRHTKNILPTFDYAIDSSYFSLFVPTIDSVCYTHLLEILLKMNKKAFFTGNTGVGKSILIQQFVKKSQEALNLAPIILNLSAQTSSAELQDMIESKLEKKRGKKCIGASGSKQCVIFVDDINMPMVEPNGAQPPIELLRQLVDNGFMYDRRRYFKKMIENYRFLCAAAPPAGGRAHLSPRFMRHFHVINIPNANEEVLTQIFQTMISEFMKVNKFAPEVQKCCGPAVAATIELFMQINSKLLPIPSKFHYLFNLRDISKVCQGILMSKAHSIINTDQFAKLWVHECQRVFMDRLNTQADRDYFKELTIELMCFRFKDQWTAEEVFENHVDDSRQQQPKVIFSMILNAGLPEMHYEGVSSWTKLVDSLQKQMSEYNISFAQGQMNLVLFEDAIDHICRITRVLNQPRGNAMLIGVAGCGKQSLTKLAAFLHDAFSFQIKIQRNYKQQNFREDLKMRLLNSGCDGRKNVLILNDTQITHDQFLEDINNLLNTGEISNLYDQEDFERMADSLEKSMKQLGLSLSADSIYQRYIESLRDNFHIILCMSPVGDLLRLRCRNFPSLVNCCTLDWFDNWPQQALETVSRQFISQNQLVKKSDQIIISKLFPIIHESVQEVCHQFFNEQKRRVYLTPKTFLDALAQFDEQLNHKTQEMTLQLTRLRNGLDKLDVTKEQIAELKIKLTELVPQLQEENEQANKQAVEIGLMRQAAQKQGIETEQEAQAVEKEAEEIKVLKDMSNAELEKAKPALHSAIKAVNELNKDDITELKKVNNPVPAVELALRCTLIYLGYTKQDWPVAQKALADMKFLDRLRNYEKDTIPDVLLARIKHLTEKPEFNIEVMTRASKAAGGLARWCYAIRIYAETQIVVKPLLERQLAMTAKFDEAQIEVQNKQQELLRIKEDIQELEQKFQATQDMIEQLDHEKTVSEKRLINASSLTELLADEQERWQAEIEQIKGDIEKLVGNVFLSVNQMSYLGAFTGNYRQQLLQEWIQLCQRKDIKISESYSITKIMATSMEIREWNIFGLPSDLVSIDNAIFTRRAYRWPLLIDPQFQALNWLKKMHKDNKKEGTKNFLALKLPKAQSPNGDHEEARRINEALELSLVNGSVVIVEDIDEFIDPSIDQIVSKATFIQDDVLQINFGNRNVEYNNDFQLFLTTKLANPHYLPEVFIKTTIINCTVTFEGLNEQLLADVVVNLEPEVERQRDALVIEISRIQNDKYALQSSILNELAESNQDTILDNVDLIKSLKNSKLKSHEIMESLARSELIEKTIGEKRSQYNSISVRGSIMYFVIASLASIDPMYLNSLEYVKKLFNETQIKMLQKIDEQEQVLQKMGQTLDKNNEDLCKLMIDQITDTLYISICQGLFESHKIIYSFLMCASVQKNAGLIGEDEYNLLVIGPGVYDKSKQLNYANLLDLHDFLTEQQWDMSNCMQQTIPKHFTNLTRSIMLQSVDWQNFVKDDSEQTSVFGKVPYPFNEAPLFMQLLLFKLFKPQNLIKALKEYVSRGLGPGYAQIPPSSLEILFGTANKITPIVFVLSQGADPNEQIMSFARRQQLQDKLHQKSLGQGQEMAAQRLIERGMQKGELILLQNCHLFKSWMPQLEIICNRIREQSDGIHEDFRLILTSLPVEFFPASILQNGLKMTTEPPQGLKANLKRTFTNIIDRDLFYEADTFLKELAAERRTSRDAVDEEVIKEKSHPGYRPTLQEDFRRQFDLVDCWKSLLFGLSFFHSILQERKKFGSLGWNIQYQFNDSDLDSSIKMLQNFIFEAEQIPWDSMQYMTGQINYGGRVTDEADRILLLALLENCYGKQILNPNLHEQLQKKKKVAMKTETTGAIPSKQRRVTKEAAKQYYQFNFSFFGNSAYSIPLRHQKFSDIQQYIEQLPETDSPEIFGMHQNAELSYWQEQTSRLLTTLQNIQEIPVVSRTSTTARSKEAGSHEAEGAEAENDAGREEGKSKAGTSGEPPLTASQKQDRTIVALSQELYEGRPRGIGKDPHAKEIFKLNSQGLLHCYSIVLLQEQERYNRLITEIESSLCSLIRAIQGLELMSPTLDQMYSSFLKSEIPPNWMAVSYASNQNLSLWYADLAKRVSFIRAWMTKGHPQAYWLSGFYFPHGFMTGILQTFARKYQKAIDFLKFKFVVLNHHQSADSKNPTARTLRSPRSSVNRPSSEQRASIVQEGPKDGVYVYGLFLESARWDLLGECLVEQSAGTGAVPMPMIHFLPFELRHKVAAGSRGQLMSHIVKSVAGELSGLLAAAARPELPEEESEQPPAAGKTREQRQVEEQQEKEEALYVGQEDTDATDTLKYRCPVYKTSDRAGALSTTGQSTNYIVSMALPMVSKQERAAAAKRPSARERHHRAEHWVLRGTALVLVRPQR